MLLPWIDWRRIAQHPHGDGAGVMSITSASWGKVLKSGRIPPVEMIRSQQVSGNKGLLVLQSLTAICCQLLDREMHWVRYECFVFLFNFVISMIYSVQLKMPAPEVNPSKRRTTSDFSITIWRNWSKTENIQLMNILIHFGEMKPADISGLDKGVQDQSNCAKVFLINDWWTDIISHDVPASVHAQNRNVWCSAWWISFLCFSFHCRACPTWWLGLRSDINQEVVNSPWQLYSVLTTCLRACIWLEELLPVSSFLKCTWLVAHSMHLGTGCFLCWGTGEVIRVNKLEHHLHCLFFLNPGS